MLFQMVCCWEKKQIKSLQHEVNNVSKNAKKKEEKIIFCQEKKKQLIRKVKTNKKPKSL